MNDKSLKAVRNEVFMPFVIPGRIPVKEDSVSTNSSLQKSNEFDQNSSFSKELGKIALFKNLRDRNPIKELRPSEGDTCMFAKIKVRNSSPIRESLTLLDRNHPIFPKLAPVASKEGVFVENFTGLQHIDIDEYEEDDDLKLIKEMYCQMISNAENSEHN